MTGRRWISAAAFAVFALAVPAAIAGATPRNSHPAHGHSAHGHSAHSHSAHSHSVQRHSVHGHAAHGGKHSHTAKHGLRSNVTRAPHAIHGKHRSGVLSTGGKVGSGRNLQPALAARNGNGKHIGALMHAVVSPLPGSGGTPGQQPSPEPSTQPAPLPSGSPAPATQPPGSPEPFSQPPSGSSTGQPRSGSGVPSGPAGSPTGQPGNPTPRSGGGKPGPEPAAELLHRLDGPPLTLIPMIIVGGLALGVGGLVGLARYRNQN